MPTSQVDRLLPFSLCPSCALTSLSARFFVHTLHPERFSALPLHNVVSRLCFSTRTNAESQVVTEFALGGSLHLTYQFEALDDENFRRSYYTSDGKYVVCASCGDSLLRVASTADGKLFREIPLHPEFDKDGTCSCMNVASIFIIIISSFLSLSLSLCFCFYNLAYHNARNHESSTL